MKSGTPVWMKENLNGHPLYIAICELMKNDYEVIVKAAEEAPSWKIRYHALKKITDQKILIKAASDKIAGVRIGAIDNLTDQFTLSNLALNDEDWLIRKYAIEKLTDISILDEVIRNDPEEFNRKVAEERRLYCIKNLADQQTLIGIALHDKSAKIRREAINRLTDINTLNIVYDNDAKYSNRDAAEKIMISLVENMPDESAENQATLADITLNSKSYKVRYAAVKKLKDQDIIRKIALNKGTVFECSVAFSALDDKSILVDIAKSDDNRWRRFCAVGFIDDQDVLSEIALKDTDNIVRINAVRKLTDRELLSEIASTDDNDKVREVAKEILSK